MRADVTQTGKIKNPVEKIDPMQLLWESQDPSVIKFIAAISVTAQKAIEMDNPADLQALRLIFANPMQLDAYQHDRSISETVSARSLTPIALDILKPEIALSVFKKAPFYEIRGKLQFDDVALPFDKVTLLHQHFIFHRQTLFLIDNPDLTRVIRFFKRNNEILLVHPSKYDAFMQSALRKLEDLVHIDYSYIKEASPAQLKERNHTIEKLVYVRQNGQNGNYIYFTPVIKYGEVEVPVWSRKQVTDTDRNGNEFKIKRDTELEVALTTIVMNQHPEFKDQLEATEYFWLHKSKFLDNDWYRTHSSPYKRKA